ncbi:hypothetical protein Pfo_011810 [Paulownia fortunei]|nr:hypothetical protein Pfo_011810 [Paulownia fortunei]
MCLFLNQNFLSKFSSFLYKMDFLLVHMVAIIFGLLFLVLLCNLWRKDPHNSKDVNSSSPPQPLGAWPIIGHLHLLSGQNHIAYTLGTLADKYGPIFTLWLGMQRAVVVSSHEAVMECFTTNDKCFANRPKSSAGEHLVYDHAAFGFTDSPYWSEMRKLISLEVASAESFRVIKKLRVSEITTSIRRLYVEAKSARPSKVVISRWVEQMTLNIIVKMIVGKKYENAPAHGAKAREVESFREIMRDITYLSGQFVLSDVIPIPLLRWMDLQGDIKGMKRVSKELEGIIQNWIDEHSKRRLMKGKEAEDQGFIDVILSTIDDKFMINAPRLTIIKTLVVNVTLGGFDTTSVYLTRFLSVLINHKEIMQRAQEEIDIKVGKQRWVQESDLNNLPYLQAIIKETLRLYPPLPLSIPHEASQDCRLGGYFIPKGTQLFVNLWKLHRYPRFWPEPERFLPERFLTGHAHEVDVTGHQFEFTPFGSGRRSCPGITFAMQVTSFTLARLLQGFDFAAPVDIIEGLGIGMVRENPLEMLVTPRLSSQLYEQL